LSKEDLVELDTKATSADPLRSVVVDLDPAPPINIPSTFIIRAFNSKVKKKSRGGDGVHSR